jgi:hypothetical protein
MAMSRFPPVGAHRRRVRDVRGHRLIAIVTAAVTSSFVGRAMRANQESIADTEAEYQHRTDDRLDALAADLAEFKALLQSLTNQPRQ